ncbi:MAG: acyl-ACP--UDP-N-acetylglucosamine O-acyltransferase [Gemmataceae bacterium]
MSATIHSTAIVDPAAQLGADVSVGPFSIITGPVRIGAGSKIGPHCHLIGPMTLGEKNDVGTGVVLGERPQHLSADGSGADLVIGSGNCFREYVTIHRGSAVGKVTTVGNNNYLMANSHVGHDSRVGNNCIFANSALLGGHTHIGDKVFLSGNAAVHQFVRLGRLAFVSGCSVATMDVPPFVIIQNINQVCGVNVVGMKRAGFKTDEISAVRQTYRMLYLQGNLISVALENIVAQLGHFEAVIEFVEFVRTSIRGVSTFCGRSGKRAA